MFRDVWRSATRSKRPDATSKKPWLRILRPGAKWGSPFPKARATEALSAVSYAASGRLRRNTGKILQRNRLLTRAAQNARRGGARRRARDVGRGSGSGEEAPGAEEDRAKHHFG